MKHARRLLVPFVAALALVAAALPTATAAMTDRPAPPDVTATYQGTPLTNCETQTTCAKVARLGEKITFTFKPASPDVASYTYRWTGSGNRGSADGSTVTIDLEAPDSGFTTLNVQSINSIGQFSDDTRFVLNIAPRPGPVGSWTFDDGSGTTAVDGPGLAHPLTLSGAAFESTGRINGALVLDGADDYASATESVVDTSQSFSISAWVRPTSATKLGVVAAVNGTKSSAAGLGYDPASKRWVFARSAADVPNPTLYKASSKEAPVNGTWSHLFATYDAPSGTLKLFVNGRLQQETASPAANAWKATGALTVGRGLLGGVTGGNFAGSLDHLQIWQRVLQPEELFALQNPRVNDRVATGEASYWPLDTALRGSDQVWRSPDRIRAADLTVSGFRGSDQSQAFVDDPDHGKVLELTGATRENVSLSRPTVDASTSFAVAVWVKLADPTKPATIVRQGTTTKDTWRLSYDPGDEYSTRWSFSRANGNGTTEAIAIGAADRESTPPGDWHLLTGEYTAQGTNALGDPVGEIRVSLDGFPLDNAYLTAARRDGSTVLGKPGSTGAPFAGRLDDLRLYVGELSPTKLCADYPDPDRCGR
ncbi:LamG domain-containing protein [Kribbella antibiotica]|nr:LamG domain-containing protein [Kribbella antibiotica]